MATSRKQTSKTTNNGHLTIQVEVGKDDIPSFISEWPEIADKIREYAAILSAEMEMPSSIIELEV